MVGSIPQPGDEHNPWRHWQEWHSPVSGTSQTNVTFGDANTVRLDAVKTDYKPGDSHMSMTWAFTYNPEPKPTPARTVRSTYTLAPAVPLFVKLAALLAVLLAAAWMGMGRMGN